MAKINSEYFQVPSSYVFPLIERKIESLKKEDPNIDLINLGIGDIALPLAPHIAQAIINATLEMTQLSSLKGYGPSLGYTFLKEAICENYYPHNSLSPDEVFISDGTNSDIANLEQIFSPDCKIGVITPSYPVARDSIIMNRRKSHLHYIPCLEKNHFQPQPPQEALDVIFLCTPNNPTGIAMDRSLLKKWIEYAQKHQTILIIDTAYRAFISSSDIPKTIYELEGAKEVAIECGSFSKSAGFTGLRCAWTVIPKTVYGKQQEKKIPLHKLWTQRQSTFSNGVSYPIQRGAEAVFSSEGKKQTEAQVSHYLQMATLLKKELESLNQTFYGGVNAPFLFWKVPSGHTAQSFADLLIDKCHLITIASSGFGDTDEHFVRLSTFTNKESIIKASKRLKSLFA